MTGRQTIGGGSPFEQQIGYARAVRAGDMVWVSGTTGYDYARMAMPERVEDQCANALATIAAALGEAGASLADVVRVRYILPDPADFEPCWPQLRVAFPNPPAATMIVARLMRPEMKIEIEVDARTRP
jgi:enamine deaminase RidA (YjgF/YER057c/UK114 family)